MERKPQMFRSLCKNCNTGVIFIIKKMFHILSTLPYMLCKCVFLCFFLQTHVRVSSVSCHPPAEVIAWISCTWAKYCFLMSVLWGGAAGQGPVGEVPTGQQGSGVMFWTVPQRTINRLEEMLRSGAVWARAKGQGPLIKWRFPAIPQWPLDSETDRKLHQEDY